MFFPCRLSHPAHLGDPGRLNDRDQNQHRAERKASEPARRLRALLVGLLLAVVTIVSGAPSAAAQNTVGAQPQNLILAVGAQGLAAPDSLGLHARGRLLQGHWYVYRLPSLPATDAVATVQDRALRLALLRLPPAAREGPHLRAAQERLAGVTFPAEPLAVARSA